MTAEIPKSVSPSHPFRTGPIMRICLIVSLFLHLFVLLTFQKAFPLHWVRPDLRTYLVELMRPPVKDMDMGNVPDTEMGRPKDKDQGRVEGGEETISLETKDERYVSYTRLIKGRIMRHWRYPPAARENLIEGRLMLVFSLERSGDMVRARILHSSGYDILDQEALRAIGAASPFPAFPDHITAKRLHIKARFDYRLAAGRSQ
ncbi:MAG: energy transducer TonB [Deltaproteobacteria bacterium]|nr:energy transducer TonB [Deltaproteobacteria bacterium]